MFSQVFSALLLLCLVHGQPPESASNIVPPLSASSASSYLATADKELVITDHLIFLQTGHTFINNDYISVTKSLDISNLIAMQSSVQSLLTVHSAICANYTDTFTNNTRFQLLSSETANWEEAR
jgi:hypothetical protein